MEVRDIIKDARIISEYTSFSEALEIMIRAQTNTLLIIDDEGLLVGELSVPDLLDAIVPLDLDGDAMTTNFTSESAFKEAIVRAQDMPVQDFMTVDYVAVHPDDGLMDIAAVAVAHQRARIPVIDHSGRPVGIISQQGLKHMLGSFIGLKANADHQDKARKQ
jgi:CBS domain-containing protein